MNIVRNLLEYLNVYGFLESVSGLARAKSGLIKAQIKNEATAVISKVIIVVIIGFTFVFFLLFASLTLSTYLNVALDSRYLGYGVVALLYLLIVIILFLIKNIRSLREFLKRIASRLFNNLR